MLYVESTNTVISAGERYVHPVTGIVYGGTDYQDPVKLAEIGAVQLYVQQPDPGFDATTWEIVDDPAHPGDKLKRPATTTPWAIDLAAKKDAGTRERKLKLAELKVSYNGWTFQADPESYNNLTAVVTAIKAGISVVEPFQWRDADDVDRLLTHAQLIELNGAMLLATLAVYQKSWALKDALAEITDPVAFRALDVSAETYWK
jgi:hypothetical protein